MIRCVPAAAVILLLVTPRLSLAQSLSVSSLTAGQGTSVWVEIVLDPKSKSISGISNELSFDPQNIPIATCEADPNLTKSFSWTFLPSGDTIRVVVASFSDAESINVPTVMYRCRIDVAAVAPLGDYDLTISEAAGSGSAGTEKSLQPVQGIVTVTAGGPGCS